MFVKVCLTWGFVLIRFRILHRLLHKNLQICLSVQSENHRIHPNIKRVCLIPLSSSIILIVHISHHWCAPCKPPSMIPLYSWCSLWSVSVRNSLKVCSPFFGRSKIIVVWVPLAESNQWVSNSYFLIWATSYYPRLCNPYHLVSHMLLSFLVFSLHGMLQTVHSRMQFLCTAHFHYSIVLWNTRRTQKLAHCLMKTVNAWNEPSHSWDLKFESNSRLYYNLLANTVFSLIPWIVTLAFPARVGMATDSPPANI